MSLAVSGSQSIKTPGRVLAGVFLFLFFIQASFIIGCSTDKTYLKEAPDTRISESHYINGVPFYPQEEFQCGPSVLASALNFLGYDIVPEDISGMLYSRRLRGTLKMDMAALARRYERDGRVSVSEVEGDRDMIKRDIDDNYPVIVFVDLGIWNIRKGHYMLIVGYDENRNGMIVYSGAEKDKLISFERFMNMWKRGGYWALRITRK